MYALRLINDEGEVIRECVSDTPWTMEYFIQPETPKRSVLTFRGSAGQTVIPADQLTVEMLNLELEPEHAR